MDNPDLAEPVPRPATEYELQSQLRVGEALGCDHASRWREDPPDHLVARAQHSGPSVVEPGEELGEVASAVLGPLLVGHEQGVSHVCDRDEVVVNQPHEGDQVQFGQSRRLSTQRCATFTAAVERPLIRWSFRIDQEWR